MASGFSLCDVCKQLPLNYLKPEELDSTGDIAFTGAGAENACPMCQLFEASGAIRKENIRWSPTSGLEIDNEGNRVVFFDPTVQISPHWSGRKTSDQVEPDLIKKWLLTCEELHHGQCPPRKDIIASSNNVDGLKTLRVIDVTNGRVVEAPRDCRYIALSYIWGKPPLPRTPAMETWIKNGLLTNPFYKNKLPSIIGGNSTTLLYTAETANSINDGFLKNSFHKEMVPRTILDAMDLVSAIGERYLWVDSLCLLQDDLDDMRDGIAHMDLVYEGAIMTIIAATGSDNNAGLPGLHAGTRQTKQVIAEVLPGVRMGSVGGLYWPLSETTYMKRGWTYQELLLSRRCVIFLDSQVFFRCHEALWTEDTLYHESPSFINKNGGMSQSIPILLDPNENPFTNYVRVVFRFNHRQFTKESDALNAMGGILRNISRRMGSGILEGLPTACFDVSLLFWHHFGFPLHRREGFPSWSWAGWSGHTDGWIPTNDGINMAEWMNSSTYVVWFKRSPLTGDVSRVWDKERLSKTFDSCVPDSLNTDSAACLDTEPYPVQTKREYKPTPLSIKIPYSYHVLQFWSYAIRVPRLSSPRKDNQAILFDCTDTICGAVYLDDLNFVTHTGPFNFILLSKCEKSFIRKWLLPDVIKKWLLPDAADRPFYWAMLIQRDGAISERKGIGFVYQDRVEFTLSPGMVWTEFVLA